MDSPNHRTATTEKLFFKDYQNDCYIGVFFRKLQKLSNVHISAKKAKIDKARALCILQLES